MLDQEEGIVPKVQRASKEQLETTVKNSYGVLAKFTIEGRG